MESEAELEDTTKEKNRTRGTSYKWNTKPEAETESEAEPEDTTRGINGKKDTTRDKNEIRDRSTKEYH